MLIWPAPISCPMKPPTFPMPNAIKPVKPTIVQTIRMTDGSYCNGWQIFRSHIWSLRWWWWCSIKDRGLHQFEFWLKMYLHIVAASSSPNEAIQIHQACMTFVEQWNQTENGLNWIQLCNCNVHIRKKKFPNLGLLIIEFHSTRFPTFVAYI